MAAKKLHTLDAVVAPAPSLRARSLAGFGLALLAASVVSACGGAKTAAKTPPATTAPPSQAMPPTVPGAEAPPPGVRSAADGRSRLGIL